jgi:hypothetical protein
MKRVREVQGGTEFIWQNKYYIRLSSQWVHAVNGGNDITPNALRIKDGVLVVIPDGESIELAPARLKIT